MIVFFLLKFIVKRNQTEQQSLIKNKNIHGLSPWFALKNKLGENLNFDNELHRLAVFEEIFYRDIEKGWNAISFYCDDCYDDFVETWPLAYSAKKAELQRAAIDLETFYSGSRLAQFFTLGEFCQLIVQLSCPTCGSALRSGTWIWPYHLPFSIPSGFEVAVDEIANISIRTPFLLLTHPFAKQVFELVKRLSFETQIRRIDERLFRARSVASSVHENLNIFDFAPAQYVAEGRYNHAGRPVLYVASTIETCVAEMRDMDCLIIAFDFTPEIKTLDLVNLDAYSEEDEELLSALCYSSLASAPANASGWDKPAYVFTRFLADCAAFAGFDAIKFPSSRLGSQDGSFNLAIINRNLSLAIYADSASYTRYINGTLVKKNNGLSI